ncbi:MAG: PAS domain S-box protein [Nitrospira sp.]|nr:PAS domain S-box protein [Nitrospira sp.]MDH4341963.1 PAS domain S-box protein [Nitrospira sp.]MDH5336879.1 PAS domain S-box protein [Nitrospira sp.]
MSTPLDTDRSMSTELVDLRRQVHELQQALAQAEQDRFSAQTSALGAAQIGTWEWDSHTNRVKWSSETEEIFGIPPGSFDGTYEKFFALVHPDDRQRLGSAIAKAVEDRAPYRIEHRIITPEGTILWVTCRGRAVFNQNEPVTGMAGTIEDITARKELELAQQDFRATLEGQVRERTAKLEQVVTDLRKEVERRQQAESALKTSEQRYQSLYEQNPFMYFTLTVEGTVLSVNQFGADQLGYQKEDLVGRSILNVFDTKDHQTVLTQLKASVASPYTLCQWEIQKTRKDGTRLWVRERARAISDLAKQPLVLISCEDITERRDAEDRLRDNETRWIAGELDRQESEQALRASELKFRTFVETTRDWVWEVNEHAIYTYASPRIREILGYEPEEVIGKTPFDLMPPDEAIRVAGLFGPIAAARQPFTLLENTNHHKNGRLVVLETSGTPIFDSAGTFRGYHGIDRDISARKRTEEALRASELRLQHFVAEAPVGLCILDENWRAISANKALCELTGYEEHETVGSTYALYTHPDDLAANIILTDEFFRGVRSEYTYEKRYIRKSGEIIWVSVKATRIELSGYTGPLLLAAVQDITERKLAMKEREQLSRDLHDNILQALYAVGMQLEAGKLSMGKSPRKSKLHMAQAVNQLNALMLDIRRFITSLTQRTTTELDFGQALQQLVTSMSSASQAPPELEIATPVLSFITPTLGEQLLNIVREALSNSTRHAQASHRWIRLSLAGNAIHLIIGDNGVGLSTARKCRAGHGLRNMAARAKQISAIFTLKSAPGEGTRVMVDIPLKREHIYE